MTGFRNAVLSDGREVRVREPKAGELRGLSLQAVITMDAAAMIKLLPRITEPALSPAEVETMRAVDFGELAGAAAGFFIPQRVAAEAAAALGATETDTPTSGSPGA